MAMNTPVDEFGNIDITKYNANLPGGQLTKNTDGTYSQEDLYGNKTTVKLKPETVAIDSKTGKAQYIGDLPPASRVGKTLATGATYTADNAKADQKAWDERVAAGEAARQTNKSGGNLGIPVIDELASAIQQSGGDAADFLQQVADKGMVAVEEAIQKNPMLSAIVAPIMGIKAGIEGLGDLFGSIGGMASTLGGSAAKGGGAEGAQSYIDQALAAYKGLPAPTAAQIQNTGIAGSLNVGANLLDQKQLQQLQALQASQFGNQEKNLLSNLLAQSQGRGGPSPAEMMLQAERDKILNSQMALAASQTGRELPVTQRQLLQGQAIQQQQAAQQAAIMRAQEQQQAQQMYAQALQAAQGNEMARAGLSTDIARANQAQAMQAALANQAAQQQAAEMTSQRQIQQAQQEMATRQFNAQQQQQAQQLAAQIASEKAGIAGSLSQAQMQTDAQRAAAEMQMRGQIIGGLLQGGASMGAAALAASDMNVKHDRENISKRDLAEFFKAYKPQSYKYNNEKWGEGDRIGFMIQDIEKTKLGKKMLRYIDNGDGTVIKGYDRDNLQGILLAALAHQAKKGKK